MNTPPNKEPPWSLYLIAFLLLLFLGAAQMMEYRRTGVIKDTKHKVWHDGTDALLIALTPLVGGVFVLGVAIRISLKQSKKRDDPDD